MKTILFFLLMVTFTASAVPLTGTKNIPGDYATLNAAITDLNIQGVGVGGVIFNVIASNTQTAPAGGYIIGGVGSLVLTTSSSTNTITIVGNANVIRAFSLQTGGSNVDAIIKIVGADYVTISGFTLQENPLNTATTNMTEWGIGLFYVSVTDGAKNNTIQNCAISLNKANANTFGIYSNTRHTFNSLSAADITNVTGSNSNNKFYGNTISNCNAGITLIGSNTSAYQDSNNDIGGSSVGTGNTIIGWGETSTATTYVSNSSERYGIYINHQKNENVSFNNVVSGNISGSASPNIMGIYKNYSVGQPSGTITSNITNNSITITDNLTTAVINGVHAIANTGITSLATATININYNTITNCTVAASSTNSNLQLILNSSVIGTLNVNYNTVTGSVTGVTDGTYSAFHNTAAVINAINVTNNQFGNSIAGVGSFINANTLTTSWVAYLVSIQAGASTCALNISNNTISGLSMVSTLTVLTLPADSEVSKVGAVWVSTNFLGSSVNINTNKFGTATEDFVKFSAATIGDLSVIHLACTTAVVNINANDFRGMVNMVQSIRHRHLYIFTHITGVITNQTINDNTFTNINVNTQANVFMILNGNKMPSAGTRMVNNNSVVSSFTKIASNGTDRVYFIYAGQPSPSGTLVTNTNNNISNVTVNGGSDILGILNYERVNGTSAPKKIINNNVCNNWTLVDGDAFGIVARDFGTDSTIITTNTVSNITSAGTIYGIYLEKPPAVHTGIVNVKNNVINNFSGNGFKKNVTGIFNETTANEIILNNNSITNLSASNDSSLVFGISSNAGTRLTFHKNTISTLSGIYNVFGVKVIGAGAGANVLDSNSISGLKCNSLTKSTLVSGIHYFSYNPVSILANNITNLESLSNNTRVFDSSAVVGISFLDSATTNNIIRDNKIYNLKATNTGANNVSVVGIATSNTVAGGTIHYNKIYDLTNSNTGASASIIGFYPKGGNWTVSNNMISLINGSNINAMKCIAVCDDGATGTRNYYHNSINIGGSASSGSSNSVGLQYNSTGNTVNIYNNIFKVIRTGTGSHFAIANTGASFVGFNCNYNALNAINATTVGATGAGFVPQSLATWRTTTSQDALSHTGLTINFVDAANGDLHLDPNNICSVRGLGLYSASYPTDWDAEARKIGIAPYGPDLGADEVFKSKVWTGTTSQNWTTASNWATGTLPTVNDDVEIPNVVNSPIIAVADNVQINSVTVKTSGLLTNNGTLNITDYLNANSSINCQAGKLNLNSPCKAQALSGTYFVAKAIKDLQISNDVYLINTLNDTLKVTQNFMFGNVNSKTFTTNSNLTLISTASNTANINDITNAGANSGNSIVGNANVERYLFAQKSWRFLATPVVISGSPSITTAWREGAVSSTSTGYGTQITGPQGVPTFDLYTQRGSLKSYNPTTNVWDEVTNPSITLANNAGYMVFVRGDRSILVGGTTGATNLRIKGDIRTGDQTFNVLANKFQSFGNPYPSRIDMRTVTKNNIANAFIVWNPNSVGLYNVGAYETYTWNGTNYVKAGGVIRNYIESGEAVFVQSNSATAGSVVVKESDKGTGSALVSRVGVTRPTLEVNLFAKDVDGSIYLADGVMLNFDNAYSPAIDNYDVRKIMNTADNLAVKNGTFNLVVERRPNLTATDTIKLSLTATRVAPYRFDIDPSILANTGLEALLIDKFLQTETAISFTDVTSVPFDITTDAASRLADRFMIVFKQAPTTNFTTISAIRNADKTVMINWGTANERNVTNYTVEQSNDGINFTAIATQTATANNGTNPTYSKQDVGASKANNWYRVKANNTNGTTKYTKIAMVGEVNEIAINGEAKISIYPNPVIDGNINLYLNNQLKGNYVVQIINATGQQIKTENITLENNNTRRIIKMTSPNAGAYQAIVTNNVGAKITIGFVVK